MVQIYDDRYKQEVLELILHVQNVEYGVDLSIEDQPDILDIIKNYINDDGCFWIALNEHGKVIGSIGLQRKSEKVAVLKKFFVYNEYRGKEHGVGALLYNYLLSFAKERGISIIILDTPSVATRSHSFYKKVGFKEITKDDLPISYDYPDRNSILFLLDI
ncbi:MAG: GNAT family N-acetyltransferase [Clostridium sp.]|uniref:GNAT family N-acetyltransferase n=1 Tax=Clostridium sp. TaxID=1506 RepID=UPI0025BA6F94|nr:GNAT family N-acetyltransferase [Clostridium sp.]MCE5221807.1 GNAT family N-acetyltransferase [Clostridium sp.]